MVEASAWLNFWNSLARARGAMMHQTMEMAQAGQLVYESAVDEKADEGEEQRLAQRRAPPVQPCGLENGAGYSADREEGGNEEQEKAVCHGGVLVVKTRPLHDSACGSLYRRPIPVANDAR